MALFSFANCGRVLVCDEKRNFYVYSMVEKKLEKIADVHMTSKVNKLL